MQKLYKSKNGMALPLVLLVLFVFVLFSTVVLSMGSSDYKFSTSESNSVQAYYYARSGAEAIASYIVENPDSLSSANLSNTINSILASGSSNPFKLSSSDPGNIVASVSKIGNSIFISTTGTYQGVSRNATYSVNISNSLSSSFDKAIYSTGPMNIIGQNVNGDIAGLDTIYLDYGKINGTVYIHPNAPKSVFSCPSWQTKPPISNLSEVFEFPEFPFPNFPIYPASLPTVTNSLNVSVKDTINSDKYYTNGINVTNGVLEITRGSESRIIRTQYLRISGSGRLDDIRSGEGTLQIFVDDDLKIDSNTKLNINIGNADVIIRAKRLLMPQGNIVVNQNGKGKLYIYVDNVLQIAGSSKINVKADMTTMGDPGKAEIYYAGGTDVNGNNITDGTNYNNYLRFGGDIKIAALMQFKQAQVSFDGSAGITGNIITAAKRFQMNGGSYADVKAIYAPNADIKVYGGAVVKGSIISKTFTLDGGATVAYQPIKQEDLDFFSNAIGKPEYSYGNWK